jgi:hypothetical protein
MQRAAQAHELEEATVALFDWQYREGVGLPADAAEGVSLAARLGEQYERVLAETHDEAWHAYALEGWAESRQVPLDTELDNTRDRLLVAPDYGSEAGPLTWRNWRAFERATDEAAPLADAFQDMVARSEALAPLLERKLNALRGAYNRFGDGQTPVHLFARREGLTPEALRAFLWQVGRACRPGFERALDRLGQTVFGRPAGPAELRALYLNRMYEPGAPLFQIAGAVPSTVAAFKRIGFDLDGVPVDIEDRPRKYPGAFCFPVRCPGDVRVSVKVATPHHLVDMLYHELGHAAHFAGIRPELPFLDRYWITSGVHETFSTLFECLLDEPLFLRAQFGFDDATIAGLTNFQTFKGLLTGAWLNAAAITVMDAWLERLAWPRIEERFAEHVLAFTGVDMPAGYARLEPFTSADAIYPAGYVLAAARVEHWRAGLRRLGGPAWWESPAAQADIRARIEAGAGVRFPAGWTNPDAFLRRYAA